MVSGLKMSKNIKELVLSYFDRSWKYPSQVYFNCESDRLRRIFATYADFLRVVEALASEGLLEEGFSGAYRRSLRKF